MKKLLLILLCFPMIGFGQDMRLDTIWLRSGDTITCNIDIYDNRNRVIEYTNKSGVIDRISYKVTFQDILKVKYSDTFFMKKKRGKTEIFKDGDSSINPILGFQLVELWWVIAIFGITIGIIVG